MRVDVKLPNLGDEEDAVPGAKVSAWLAQCGDELAEGDDLLELTTDKAAFVVACPQDGVLTEQRVAEGNEIAVGDVLGVLEVKVAG